jgi:hypothetical protein
MNRRSIWAVGAGALVVGQRKRGIRRRERLELVKLVGKVDYDRRYSYKRERRAR